MGKFPKIVAVIMIVAGVIMIVVGGFTYYQVQEELADEKIVVSDDAERFAGEDVTGPLTAYSEAETIKKHASEIADGQTYAELEQDDPRRESVMTASFLRASLFTSVVAFGVAFLVMGLGVLFILLGIAMLSIIKYLAERLVGEPAADTVVVTDEEPLVVPPPPGTAVV
jgi:hypothetical protein